MSKNALLVLKASKLPNDVKIREANLEVEQSFSILGTPLANVSALKKVTTQIRCCPRKLFELLPILTNKGISLKQEGIWLKHFLGFETTGKLSHRQPKKSQKENVAEDMKKVGVNKNLVKGIFAESNKGILPCKKIFLFI